MSDPVILNLESDEKKLPVEHFRTSVFEIILQANDLKISSQTPSEGKFSELNIDSTLLTKLEAAFGGSYIKIGDALIVAGGFESMEDIVRNWGERFDNIKTSLASLANLGIVTIYIGQYAGAAELMLSNQVESKMLDALELVRNKQLLANLITLPNTKNVIHLLEQEIARIFQNAADMSFKGGKVKVLKNDLSDLVEKIKMALDSKSKQSLEV